MLALLGCVLLLRAAAKLLLLVRYLHRLRRQHAGVGRLLHASGGAAQGAPQRHVEVCRTFFVI
jgi:hypothetical protein